MCEATKSDKHPHDPVPAVLDPQGRCLVCAIQAASYELAREVGRLHDKLAWQPIESAPRDGTEVIVLIDCADVAIVRTAWWRDADEEFDESDVGWWSYRHSVTQEKLEGAEMPTHWIAMPTGGE